MSAPLLALIFAVTAGIVASYTPIYIVAPVWEQKAHSSGFEEVPAMFGFPKRGEELTGMIATLPEGNTEACTPIPPLTDPDVRNTVIALVDRGHCFFATKLRNAQNAGADAVIMVDNIKESYIPHMADDGTGADITIPSMLISLDSGNIIKGIINGTTGTPTKLVVTMSWNPPRSSNPTVPWTFWTDSNDEAAVLWKQSFASAATMLDASAAPMRPRYLMFDGDLYGCTLPENPCGGMCMNGGRYCATDPDMPGVGLDGVDVVAMNLYQICVWITYHTPGWFTFVNAFNTQCVLLANPDFSQACADRVATSVGQNPSLIATCIHNSNATHDGTNTLLEAELNEAGQDGIEYLPSVIINDKDYNNDLTCDPPIDITHCDLLKSICFEFPVGKQPSICMSSAGCPLGQARDGCGVCNGTGQIDPCGVCLPPSGAAFGKSCAGCDGVPNSGKQVDACGVCGGTTQSFSECVQQTSIGSQVMSVNASVSSELAALRAELASLRGSINSACFSASPNPSSSSSSSTERPAGATACPVDNGTNNPSMGSSSDQKKMLAIAISLSIITCVLGAAGFIVWKRRRLVGTGGARYVRTRDGSTALRAHSSLDHEDDPEASSSLHPTGGKPVSLPKHTLLVDREESGAISGPPLEPPARGPFAAPAPAAGGKAKSAAKAKGKKGGGDINVPLIDASTDEDL